MPGAAEPQVGETGDQAAHIAIVRGELDRDTCDRVWACHHALLAVDETVATRKSATRALENDHIAHAGAAAKLRKQAHAELAGTYMYNVWQRTCWLRKSQCAPRRAVGATKLGEQAVDLHCLGTVPSRACLARCSLPLSPHPARHRRHEASRRLPRGVASCDRRSERPRLAEGLPAAASRRRNHAPAEPAWGV